MSRNGLTAATEAKEGSAEAEATAVAAGTVVAVAAGSKGEDVAIKSEVAQIPNSRLHFSFSLSRFLFLAKVL